MSVNSIAPTPYTSNIDVNQKPLENSENSNTQKKNGNKLLLGSLAALAIGVIAYIATKGKKAPKKAPTQPTPKTPQTPSIPSGNNTTIDFEALRLKLINKFGLDEKFFKTRPQWMYSNILREKYYQVIRHPKTPYAARAGCNSHISVTTEKANKYVRVLPQSGWHFRLPLQRSSAPIVDRISLNVYPEDALIAKLDKLVAQSGGTIEYKTSVGMDKWNKRHDPITIYFHRPVNKNDETQIVKLVQPHVRSDKNMLGRKISDGIYQVLEPKEKDVLALINRAEKMGVDPKLIDCLKNPDRLYGAHLYDTNSKGETIVRTSPGLMEAAKRFIDDLEKGIF